MTSLFTVSIDCLFLISLYLLFITVSRERDKKKRQLSTRGYNLNIGPTSE